LHKDERRVKQTAWKRWRSFQQSCPDKTAIYTVFLAAMQPQANTVLSTDSRGLSPAFRYASYILEHIPLIRRDRETDREASPYTYPNVYVYMQTRAWMRIRVHTHPYMHIHIHTHIYLYTYI